MVKLRTISPEIERGSIPVSTIEIDFDVFKALTNRRASETTTYNDVLRELLGMSSATHGEVSDPTKGCTMQGVFFSEGTLFQVVYKGSIHRAQIKGSHWVGDDGQVRRSPSDAASAITKNNVNGWRFWSFKRPTDASFRKMRVLQDA